MYISRSLEVGNLLPVRSLFIVNILIYANKKIGSQRVEVTPYLDRLQPFQFINYSLRDVALASDNVFTLFHRVKEKELRQCL
jgi:hypothetical protein